MSINDNHSPELSTNAWCFLVEKEQPWSEVLADVLKQDDIPFFKQGDMGAGLSLRVGPMFERFQFYVPQDYLQRAQLIVDDLFSEKQEVI